MHLANFFALSEIRIFILLDLFQVMHSQKSDQKLNQAKLKLRKIFLTHKKYNIHMNKFVQSLKIFLSFCCKAQNRHQDPQNPKDLTNLYRLKAQNSLISIFPSFLKIFTGNMIIYYFLYAQIQFDALLDYFSSKNLKNGNSAVCSTALNCKQTQKK